MAAILALAAGTIWGDDHHYPFGPFRMYSTRNDPNGTVSVVRLRATTVNNEEITLHSKAFGLRPAEIDGLLISFDDDSQLAAYLAEAYGNVGGGPPLSELRIGRDLIQLERGRAVGYSEHVLGVWRSVK